MKIQYLGTAAAEGMPAVFCNCEYCREARRLGGKNIRTRSQAIINDDLLIDLPADTYMHFLNNNIEGDKIKYLLITHSHTDHFYPAELKMHGSWYAHDLREPNMEMFCGKGTYEKFKATTNVINVTAKALEPFETVKFGKYTVTTLPANHYHGDGALFYIIEQGDKTILYGHDTGYFYEEVFEFIEKKNYRFDLISLDCTQVDIPTDDKDSHMGLGNIRNLVKRLKDVAVVTDSAKIVVNHFSHNGNPLHHIMEEKVANDGYIVSYDGMNIEI